MRETGTADSPEQNIILTGLPRGSTTLTCHLLNQVNNVVALHEPLEVGKFIGLSRAEILEGIDAFFAAARQSLLEDGVAPSKVEDGRVPDNPWSDSPEQSGLRGRRTSKGEIRIERALAPDFRLVIKHPAMFTALLPDLVDRWRCFAVIRNPLGVLLSWASLPSLPVHKGRARMAEVYDDELRVALDAIPDVLERRLHLLNWAFARYRDTLPVHQVIRYEDTIATGGRSLVVVDSGAAALKQSLASKNTNPLYDRAVVESTAACLIERGGAYEHWYSRQDIENLSVSLLGGASR